MSLGAEALVLSRDHYGRILKIHYFFSSGGAVGGACNAKKREFKT